LLQPLFKNRCCYTVITLPTGDACPAATAVYEPGASASAAAGSFPVRNLYDTTGPDDPPTPCQNTTLQLNNGSSLDTCAFYFSQSSVQGPGSAAEPLSGVVVTDRLVFGTGLTGFDTWQDVELNPSLGAVE
jgi:hypothetical protein